MTIWTEHKNLMFGSLWRAGYTGQRLADYFRVSRSAALGKAHRLGLLGSMTKAERTRRQIAGTILGIQRSRERRAA